MTDDIPASGQVRPEDEAKGQKMTIYMPQGAIIIERSELEPPAESPTQTLSEETQVSPKAGNEPVQSLGAIIDINTGGESHSVKEQSHSKALASDSANVDEQQVLLRISEMLDVITKRLNHDVQPIVQSVQPMDSVIRSTNPDDEIEKKSAIVRDDQNVEKNSVSNEYHFDWIHAFNLLYISVILFILLLPTGLQSLLKLEVTPALINYEVAGIQRGDLIIAKETRASALVVGDVLSLHDAFSGTSEVIQVSQITPPGDNGVMTIAIPPRVGQTLSLSYSVNADLKLFKVVKSVPTLGVAKMLLDSFFVQFFVGISVILLNVVVHFRRHRRFKFKQ